MAAVEDDTATGQWPLCAIGGVSRRIDAGAWKGVLTRGGLERVAAPCGLEEFEMSCCATDEGCEGNERGQHRRGSFEI